MNHSSSIFLKNIVKYDTDINKIGLLDGDEVTPLALAVVFKLPFEIIKLLLEKGANPNVLLKPKEGTFLYTPFMVVVLPGIMDPDDSFIDPKLVQLFLDYKADINIKNSADGKTAYDYMKENEEFKKTSLFKKLSSQF